MGHRSLPPILFGVTLLAAWHIIASLGVVPSYVLPAPIDVARRLVSGVQSGYLISATGQTLLEALLGCLAAAILGIPLGYLLAKSQLAAHVIEPYLAASQAVPAVALAPLIVVWMGYGTLPITVLCTIIVIFPVIVSTATGMRTLDREVVDAARLDGAAGADLAWRIELPLAAPTILAGIRTGFTLSITGAIVGEMVMGGEGLGAALAAGQGSTASTTFLFAVIALLAVLAIGIYLSLHLLERRLDPLRESS